MVEKLDYAALKEPADPRAGCLGNLAGAMTVAGVMLAMLGYVVLRQSELLTNRIVLGMTAICSGIAVLAVANVWAIVAARRTRAVRYWLLVAFDAAVLVALTRMFLLL